MTIYLNDIPLKLESDHTTVADLVKLRSIRPEGTAIAVNDKMIKRLSWNTTLLSDLDRVTVISMAFGG